MFGFKSNLKKRMTEAESVLFSSRTADTFMKMYLLIASVDLKSNSAVIESGGLSFCGEKNKRSFKFTELVNILSGHVHPDDRDTFKNDFSVSILWSGINSSFGGFQSVYMLQTSSEDSESGEISCDFVEIRADAIPEGEKECTKCMLYLRKVGSRRNDFLKAEKSAELYSLRSEYLDLLGKDDAVFLEYNADTDIMILHSESEEAVVKHYYENLRNRTDWSISRADVSAYKELVSNAKIGKAGSMVLRCRPSIGRDWKFKYYRLMFKPAEDFKESKQVYGILKDIDEQYVKSIYSEEMIIQIGGIFKLLLTDVFELDVENNTIATLDLDASGNVYAKEVKPAEDNLRVLVKNGHIHKDYVDEYLNWVKKGYLQKKTAGGKNYDIETKVMLPGDKDYRWCMTAVCPLKGHDRYLCMVRDISEMKEQNDKQRAAEEQSRSLEEGRAMLDVMASLVEFRNIESGDHIVKVRQLTEILLKDLAERSPDYGLTPKIIENYTRAATMHDIGKIAIPDTILNKPGKLTDDEFDIMKCHTLEGSRIIERVPAINDSVFLEICRDSALHHHERYDGSGYPDGLVGDENAIGVQVIGLADVFDALVSVRCYKESLEVEEVIKAILNGEMGSFNPRLLESFKHSSLKMAELYK